jgi:hypothetical protein
LELGYLHHCPLIVTLKASARHQVDSQNQVTVSETPGPAQDRGHSVEKSGRVSGILVVVDCTISTRAAASQRSLSRCFPLAGGIFLAHERKAFLF